ncbi:uncharacterized protein N7529_002235 [Penicillium soppii]|uniref:uncharacterized protein n=1 Tax=Penicillium soppii TaxID=69789 RepID=UPI0025480428|nr:uncharacterized protein N7529_002235 [Penicillium soppii]KAJ5873805.1 hypothetical protein N7529_002235 [Penicillium soppii]
MSFWRSMLCNGRILGYLLIEFSSVTVSTSLYATLPLHIQENFKWDLSATGLLFAGITVPDSLISPLASWVRDRIGARYPAAVGFIVQAYS